MFVLVASLLSGCETEEERDARISFRAICTAYEFLEQEGYSKLRRDVTQEDIPSIPFNGVRFTGTKLTPQEYFLERYQSFGALSVYAAKDMKDFDIIYFRRRGETPCIGILKNGKIAMGGLRDTCNMYKDAVRRNYPAPKDCPDKTAKP